MVIRVSEFLRIVHRTLSSQWTFSKGEFDVYVRRGPPRLYGVGPCVESLERPFLLLHLLLVSFPSSTHVKLIPGVP